MRILFVSANPDWTPRLDLMDELRELKKSLKGKHYELELLPAAQPEDLKDAIEGSKKPIDILHFSGHATRDRGLFFRQSNGTKKAITHTDLNKLFENKPVKLAFLNACNTSDTAVGIKGSANAGDTAPKIKGFANTVIGTSKVLAEDAAKMMTKVLYSELAKSGSIDDAYAEATKIVRKAGLDDVYISDRADGEKAPKLDFSSGDVKVDLENEDKWDRFFFERYLEEQIESVTENVRMNYRVLRGLIVFGVVLVLFSWGQHIYLSVGDADGFWQGTWNVVAQVGDDIATAATALIMVLLGLARNSLDETPLLDWLTNIGEAIPVFIASIQHRWCVHGNEKLRQLKSMKELVEHSETLSDTLRVRLHKILGQSIYAANMPPISDDEFGETGAGRIGGGSGSR